MALTSAGSELTRLHRAEQLRIADQIERLVRTAWPLLDPNDLDATVRIWMNALLPVIEAGRADSAALAAAYLQTFGQAETGAEIILGQLPAAPLKAAETSLRVTGPVSIKALTANGMAPEAAVQSALQLVIGSIRRQVLDGGRDQILAAAETDPALTGWRRIVRVGGCDFCEMLQDRGGVYSGDTVRFASHDWCSCSVEPAYDPGQRVSVMAYTASKRRITDADRARVRTYLSENHQDQPR